MSLAIGPVNDRRVLTFAHECIHSRGKVATGGSVRDAYVQACRRGGFYPARSELGATISWTAALRRLVKAEELVEVPLVTRRGAPAGIGFELPQP